MKVLLYSEGKSSFSKSGVGQALNHQVEALGANNIEVTQDPEDDYDLAHINTVALKSYEVLKQAKKKGKPVIYHTHTTYEDFRGSIKGSYVLSPIIKFWTKKLYNEATHNLHLYIKEGQISTSQSSRNTSHDEWQAHWKGDTVNSRLRHTKKS